MKRVLPLHCVVLILAFTTLWTGCKKEEEADVPPNIALEAVQDGLLIDLTITSQDPENAVTELSIDWGDSDIDIIQGISSTTIEEEHLYDEPSETTITVTAWDADGDKTEETVVLNPDFAAVDLSGIKNTLYKDSEDEFLILTVNLHTYQEDRQNEKFHIITELIGQMDVDLIALQECAQHQSAELVSGEIKADNMALILSERIQENYGVDYSFVWDWAHYGWNVWEEGLAVMSKHPITDSEGRYISSSQSTSSIISRKGLHAAVSLPQGDIDIFSVHTHWRTSESDTEQDQQVMELQAMVEEKELQNSPLGSIVCGDFNSNPTSSPPWDNGYVTMLDNGTYVDTFLEVYPDANDLPQQHIYNTIGGSFPGGS
ncbi:MAG: hypothetical protein HKN79_00665, partial [Flavobacteriales bacterium]|nr:hypothetical protein [Flavobacteriales bacterium]